jgi:undecaprenyl phosphate N,N'-diacetylbacillosamine 1-phosphate transferase
MRFFKRCQVKSVALRVIKFLVCGLAIIILCPIWLVLSIPVMISMRASPIFVQVRLGENRKPFRILKIRTMRKSDRGTIELGPIGNHHELVPALGFLLRRSKFDETLQLFNIWRGEMNFIGPRPQIFENSPLDECCGPLRWTVKPGLVGLAEISGNLNLTKMEDEILTNYFVANRSQSMDYQILADSIKTAIIGSRRDEALIQNVLLDHRLNCQDPTESANFP